jgi:RNA polymerase sigma-70 factor (ECF subfamily)
MDDDLQAIRRLKNGDIGGLESLVTRYQVRAARAAFLIVRDPQTAEEITQETFIRVFKHIRRFDESRPFGPYLLRSVVNAALDASRNSSKWQQVEVGLEGIEALFDQAATVEAQADFNTLKGEILAALGQLSARQRAAVVLRYSLEMSEKEIADCLKARPGTVKWLLNAARERLRGLLGGQRSLK